MNSSLETLAAAGTPLAAFTAYVKAFETLNPEAVIPHCHEPCLLISPEGVNVLHSRAEAAGAFARLMAGLRPRGYHKSSFENLSEKRLSEIVATVSGLGVWLKADGSVLERFGATYTFRKTDAWRIVTTIIHDPV